MAATSRDVAREAGVSQATVSRVLTAGTPVSEKTRARVMDAMTRIGYVPNRAARTMKTGRTGTIGVVVADLGNPFYPQLLEALSRSLDASDHRMTVWVSDGGKNQAALDAIREGTVDGVIFTTVTEHSHELARALEQRSPLVLVNRTVEGADCDQVSSANRQGAGLIANYLVSHGRTRVAFIGGTPLASTTAQRLGGFSDRLARLGYPLPDELVAHGAYTHESGCRTAARLLHLNPGINALVCSNDLLAFAALDTAKAAGIRVPEDLWVIGYDDIQQASWQSLNLTTVRQDVAQLAAEATRLLLARLDDPDRPAIRVELEPTLVVRASSAFAPA